MGSDKTRFRSRRFDQCVLLMSAKKLMEFDSIWGRLFCFVFLHKVLYIKNERSEKSFYFCSGLHTRIKREKEKEKNMKPRTLNQNSDRF